MFSITELNKKFKSNNKLYWFLREEYVVVYSTIFRLFDRPVRNKKKRILFYHINSLGFAGTEKFLQILAKYLNKEINEVYYMYPNKLDENPKFLERFNYLQRGGVILLPFDCGEISKTPPYVVRGMNPDIKNIIKTLHIDLLVTADSGHANYPFSIIKNIPVLLLNIFGQPNLQKNITYHVCISKEVGNKLRPIVPDRKIKVFPVPSEGPFKDSIAEGKALREKFGINDSDVVFGRIGRNSDDIYDPIGIEAFKKALEVRNDIHYIIMAPPPILEKKVKNENIRNVHFIAPSSKDEDVWAFHAAIDTLAHFRNDGESFGLNIVESMLSKKPIITHKSHVWNAHLEYLDSSFSRVVEKDDIENYTKYMLEFAQKKATGELEQMGGLAQVKAEKLFLIRNNITVFESLVGDSISRN